MKTERLWPIGIGLVLALTVAGNGYVLWKSLDPDAAAIEPNYYAKAVAWDSTQALGRASRSLGWQLDARLIARGGGRVEARLTTARGMPVRGAEVKIAAIHNLGGGRFETATLNERTPGLYAADLPLTHLGLWELRFDARRGAERFVLTLHRDLSGAEGR